MKLFTLGPVEMYDRTRYVASKQVPYFRVQEFSDVVLDTAQRLKHILHAPEDYRVVLMTNSGTGAMEAAIMNCFTANDKLLIIDGGRFSEYFKHICKVHAIPFDVVDVPLGHTLNAKDLLPFEQKHYAALLVNIHETSTGQLYDKQMLSEFCKRNKMLFVVDAISSICADEYDIEKHSIDLTILSSQKGLATSPGLAMIVLSPELIHSRIVNNRVQSVYFDLKDHLLNMERGQTPFTPSVGAIYEVNDMLRYLMEIGINNKVAHTKMLADCFREMALERGYAIPEYPLSNAMTPIFCDDQIDAFTVHGILKEKYDVFINPSGLMPSKILRVGHLGNLNIKDMQMVANLIHGTVEELRNGLCK